jgi:hypothetical protein
MLRKNAISSNRQAWSDTQPAGVLFLLPCDQQGCRTHLESWSKNVKVSCSRDRNLYISMVCLKTSMSVQAWKGPQPMPRHCITWYNHGFTVINILFFQQIAGSGTARRKALKGHWEP